MARADFINILQEIRGTGAPGVTPTDGIWYELMTADKNGNPGVYGDILDKYGVLKDNLGNIETVADLEEVMLKIIANEQNINDAVLNEDNITKVALNQVNIDKVADNEENIGKIVTNEENINKAVANEENITKVAESKLAINTVTLNLPNIKKVADNDSNVTRIGTDLSHQFSYVEDNGSIVDEVEGGTGESVLGTVSNNIDKLTQVHTNLSKLIDVANRQSTYELVLDESANIQVIVDDVDTIGIVATDIGKVNTVAGISGNVTTVAGIETEVVGVYNNRANITAVAGNKVNVDKVAGLEGHLNTVVTEIVPHMTEILDADVNAAIATAAASGALASAAKASISETNAESSADEAQLRAWEAEAKKRTADSYATEAADTYVREWYSNGDGTFGSTVITEYSAKHYRDKAVAVVGGGLSNFSRYGVVEGLNVTKNALDGTKYDISAGKYYIGDVLYEIANPIEGISTGLAAGEDLLVIGLNTASASSNTPVTSTVPFTGTQRSELVELGALATAGGSTEILAVGDSSFNATNVLNRVATRAKYYEGTVFSKDTCKIAASNTSMQLDMAGGELNDAELDDKQVVADTNIGGVLIKHDGSGNWVNTSVDPIVIDSTEVDSGTGMVPANAGRYLTYVISRSSRTGTVYVVAPQAEYSTFSAASNIKVVGNAIIDSIGLDVSPLALVVVRVGDTSINDSSIIDIRNVVEKFRTSNKVTDGSKNLSSFGNGSIVEEAALSVVSDGTVVTFNYADPLNSHLTCQFEERNYQLANGSVVLTAGTDTNPVVNYVYVVKNDSTVSVEVSTTGFPDGVHCPIAKVVLQSAGTTQTDGPLLFQERINHMQDSNGTGHLYDINRWISMQEATYIDGIDTTANSGIGVEVASGLGISISTGNMLQLHRVSTAGLNIAIDGAYVLNDQTTPYKRVYNLDQLVNADGEDMSGSRFNVVVFVSGNADGSSKMYLNMPTGIGYNKDADAIADISNTAVYTLPGVLKGTTILAARVTIRHTMSGYRVVAITKLTGLSTRGTASSGTVKNEYSDSEFKVIDDVDSTKVARFEVSGVSTATERVYKVPNENGTILVGQEVDGDIVIDMGGL